MKEIIDNSNKKTFLLSRRHQENQKSNNWIKKWVKDFNRNLTKEEVQLESKHVKRCLTLLSLGNCKLTRWDTTTHQNPGLWQHQTLVRTWSNKNSHSMLMGMQNVQPLWKAVYQFLKKLNIRSSNHAPRYLLKGVGNYVHTKKTAPRWLQQLYSSLPKLWSNQDALR